MTSSEGGHTHCTRKNSSVVVNPFTDNTEVLLNSKIASVNPFTNNDITTITTQPTSDSPDIPPPSPQKLPPKQITKPNITIRVNVNNSIIHTNLDKSTSTPDNDTSPFTLNTKIIYKGTRATIVKVIKQDDEFLEPLLQIRNILGKTKVVGHTEINVDLLAIPSDISFATSFVTSETNSFATSKHSKRSKSSQAREESLLQLEKKIVHNNQLLTTLQSSTKISSIDEITEPSTTFKSIITSPPAKNTTTTFSTNHCNHIPPSVEMVDTNISTDLDINALSTAIVSVESVYGIFQINREIMFL